MILSSWPYNLGAEAVTICIGELPSYTHTHTRIVIILMSIYTILVLRPTGTRSYRNVIIIVYIYLYMYVCSTFVWFSRSETHSYTHIHHASTRATRSLQITVISTVRVGITHIIPTQCIHLYTHIMYLYVYTHTLAICSRSTERVPYIILYNNISPEHAPGALRHRSVFIYFFFPLFLLVNYFLNATIYVYVYTCI